MSQQKQAITGINSSAEVEIRNRYPSLAATGVGRVIGRICDSIPTKVWGIKISHLLFALPFAPMAAGLYVLQKLAGEKYILTNHSIQRCSAIGAKQLQSCDLKEISDIEITQQDGQEFYRASDLSVLDAEGSVVMKIAGVPNADIFRESILKARDARTETAEALATINARQTA